MFSTLAIAADEAGTLIPVEQINQRIVSAIMSDGVMWCSPATLIGPRTFITAAHCVPYIQDEMKLRVRGPQVDEILSIEKISMPSVDLGDLTDEKFFSSAECKKLFEQIENGTTLSPEQLKICWANGGKPDIALITVDKDFSGPMASLRSLPVSRGEKINLLRLSPKCDGNRLKFYDFSELGVFGFNNSQMILDGLNDDGTHAKNCHGSGGIYFEKDNERESLEIVAIHSVGLSKIPPIKVNGKTVSLPPYYFGGAYVMDAVVQRWLKETAAKHNLKICGLNMNCPRLNLF